MVDLCFTSACELARLVRTKQVSSRELVTAHLKQIARINPKVNAVVTLTAESALEAAAAADEHQARGYPLKPLHGLPVLHKDLFETKGIRTTYGSAFYKDHIPDFDHVMVLRLAVQGGAIALGKTNTPEFGAGSQTFNTLFGATLNPYDLTKTCGGSSGGSAVALACGFAPIATGTDIGGSLRNPAAFCNVVGLRGTAGRFPGGRADLAWNALSTQGCMARSAACLTLALGPFSDAGDEFRNPLLVDSLDRDFRGVRIAWFKDLGGVPFDPQVRAIVDAHRATCESLGCIVEQAEPDFSPAEISFRIARAFNSAASHGPLFKRRPDVFKPVLRREIEDGLRLTSADIAEAQAAHVKLRRNVQKVLQKYEYFILPTTQLPPFDVNLEYPTEITGVKMANYIDWMKSCWYISAAGLPAASVPAGFTADGLPVGLQIVGRSYQDFAVLQLAHAFEQATGFAKNRPAAYYAE